MSKFFQSIKQRFSKRVEGYFAKKYDELVRNNEQAQEDFKRLAYKTAAVIQEGNLLDIGSGPAYISIEIAKLLPNVKIIGIDISDTMIEIATKNIEEQGLSERIILRKEDACKMTFNDSSFNFAISSDSLHHWKKPIQVLSEVFRVLKPGSKAFITDFTKDAPKEKIREVLDLIDFRIMRWGVEHEIKNNSYTMKQAKEIIMKTEFEDSEIRLEGVNLEIWLEKAS